MHSMQAGYMEKAQKYTDKAFVQIEKLRSEYCVHCDVGGIAQWLGCQSLPDGLSPAPHPIYSCV